MSKTETPYLTHGLGYEEDERIIGKEPYFEDVLALADHLIKKYPSERWSIMHHMFMIGFNCGRRAESEDELLHHAVKLTSIANQNQIIERLLEIVDYSRVSGDNFVVLHQIQSGLLDDIGDNLSDIKDEIQKVSIEICPD